MNKLEEKIIELGGIDSEIVWLHIDNWFENAKIVFRGKNNKEVICSFEKCFEIKLKHDRNYSKEKKTNNDLDYKYYIQDIKIIEDGEFYIFTISAWPLEGEFVCKKVCVDIQN